MTVETSCYVCGKEGPAINGLCYECTMQELFNPGAAFAATFGSLDDLPKWPVQPPNPAPASPQPPAPPDQPPAELEELRTELTALIDRYTGKLTASQIDGLVQSMLDANTAKLNKIWHKRQLDDEDA